MDTEIDIIGTGNGTSKINSSSCTVATGDTGDMTELSSGTTATMNAGITVATAGDTGDMRTELSSGTTATMNADPDINFNLEDRYDQKKLHGLISKKKWDEENQGTIRGEGSEKYSLRNLDPLSPVVGKYFSQDYLLFVYDSVTILI